MKKRIFSILAAALVLSLAACGSTTDPGAIEDTEQQTAASTQTDSSETAGETAAAEPEADGGTLIAYFSWSGNTEQMAQAIRTETGGDLYQIEPAVPYTDDYDALLDIAQLEQAENARPELASPVENWDSYDVIFVGYPNWWSDAPMAVYTFLEAYDFTGKTLIPFNTSASGGVGRSRSGIEESAVGANILEDLALTEGELGNVQGEVSSWRRSEADLIGSGRGSM